MGLLLWAGFILSDVPFYRLEKVQTDNVFYENSSKEKSVLEEGSIVSVDEIKNYFLFTNAGNSYKRWFNEKIKEGHIEYSDKNRKYLLINTTQHFNELLFNDCELRFCYQHKIAFEKIPSIFWKGLIGIEDYRFLNHFGVDFKSILRAIVTDIIKMKFAQGASTLTQQLVKNIFLTSKKTIGRKLKEMLLSVYIEYRLKKDDILEAYFNEVYWGSLQGVQIKGLHAASVFYFGKKPDMLMSYEAAILISLLKGPGYYHPIRHLDRLISRTKAVYNRLIELNLFSRKYSRVWTDKDWSRWSRNLEQKNSLRPYNPFSYTNEWESDLLSYFENYLIYKKAAFVLSWISETFGYEDIAVKIIMGKPYSNIKEMSYYSKFERKKDVAINQERHQVGSILKPVIYSIFTRKGKKLSDIVSTEPIALELKSGRWSPKEAHKNLKKEVTLSHALMKSYNRPLIRLANEIGFDIIEKELVRYIPDLKLPLAEYPSQMLGAVELSLKQIYQLYALFIREECQRVLFLKDSYRTYDSPLFLLSNPEQTTISKVVEKEMGGMRFFGKTGTSNNGHNNWFVFFDGSILGVIWVGYDGDRTGKGFTLYGSTTAFQIYQHFFRDRGRRFNELTCENYVGSSRDSD
ncbi:MAG: transglycosylase domain-containing protein [Bacteriovoracaceae bacterium]|nr:transglycosylase domain-containing protein [Bacteriovoracaceae bacterium]